MSECSWCGGRGFVAVCGDPRGQCALGEYEPCSACAEVTDERCDIEDVLALAG